jgi:hypothetical protein
MNPSSNFGILPLFFGSLLALSSHGPAQESIAAQKPVTPAGLVLTWRNDPATTMVIDWHRRESEQDEAAVIRVREAGGAAWQDHPAARRPFPHGKGWIDRVELEKLRPATSYEFQTGGGGRVYSFMTMPSELKQPLTFAAGGDVMHARQWMETVNRVVMKRDPAFVLWVGDLAYADGIPGNVGRWENFLAAMCDTLITPQGRVVPVIVGIGNHEIRGGNHNDRIRGPEDRKRLAPFFYDLFAFPGQPGYGVLDFGRYLSLVVGDSGHSNPIDGKQTNWLERTLKARQDFTHVIPVYHVPAWPSAREFDNPQSVQLREHWVPLFEKYGISLAMENHDHTLKRTVPIHDGKRDDARGIIYLGDGAWGVDTREVKKAGETWYLEKSAGARHAWIITLDRNGKKAEALAEDGSTLDVVELPLTPGRR